jgi:hypothetical protein
MNKHDGNNDAGKSRMSETSGKDDIGIKIVHLSKVMGTKDGQQGGPYSGRDREIVGARNSSA